MKFQSRSALAVLSACLFTIAPAGSLPSKELVLRATKSTAPSGQPGKLGTVRIAGGDLSKPMQVSWSYDSGGSDRGIGIMMPGSNVIAATFGPGAAAIAIYKRDSEGENIEAIWSLCDPASAVAPYKLKKGKDESEYLIENNGGKLILEKQPSRTAKVTWELPTGTYHGLAVAHGSYLAAVSITEGSKAGVMIYTADNESGTAIGRWTMSGASGAGEDELVLASADDKPGPTAATDSSVVEIVKRLAAELRGNKAALMKLKPSADQIAAIAGTEEDARALAAYADKVFAGIPDSGIGGKEGQTEIRVTLPENLPGGYSRHASHFKPGLKIYGFKYVAPGESLGMAFDGLVQVGGQWIMIPKMWRAFE